jgi:hypothetical protein
LVKDEAASGVTDCIYHLECFALPSKAVLRCDLIASDPDDHKKGTNVIAIDHTKEFYLPLEYVAGMMDWVRSGKPKSKRTADQLKDTKSSVSPFLIQVLEAMSAVSEDCGKGVLSNCIYI